MIFYIALIGIVYCCWVNKYTHIFFIIIWMTIIGYNFILRNLSNRHITWSIIFLLLNLSIVNESAKVNSHFIWSRIIPTLLVIHYNWRNHTFIRTYIILIWISLGIINLIIWNNMEVNVPIVLVITFIVRRLIFGFILDGLPKRFNDLLPEHAPIDEHKLKLLYILSFLSLWMFITVLFVLYIVWRLL